ncbi:MAG TPA: universal stress protein [Nitrospinaceae bacterium]|nr:universal stress protein [Nitrospinaceae bacterium]|tara:strand:- start:571 stop:2640 length:2070 start_codon:yes stop_codon:yes gene_type:complete
MFDSIYLPVDNSDYSNVCIDMGLELAQKFGSRIVASHVYAAKMHDVRFRQMESGLPEEYQDETELEKQRGIHDQLITKGMEVITDSYLDVPKDKCKQLNIPFEGKSLEGRNYTELVCDIKESKYDLVVMGALGLGAIKDSLIGTVAERVVRRTQTDTLLVKYIPELHGERSSSGKIVVSVDGSGQSFGGLKTGIELARKLNKPLEIISTFDPYFHYAMFNSLTGVLSREASKVFKFEQQEKLHEDIIDKGLAKIYQAHLEVSRKIVEEEGMECTIRLLDGKVFEKVLQYAREENPYLLILGRIGVHSGPEMDIGGNAENLMRMVPCNVLLSSRTFKPSIDMQAEESIEWTAEGRERLQKIPGFVRPMATSAILRYALERGHSMITSSVITEAVEKILPAGAMQAMRQIGEKIKDEGVDLNTEEGLKTYKDEMMQAHAGESENAEMSEAPSSYDNGDEGKVEMAEENVVATEDGRNSNGAQVANVTFQCKHCHTFMEPDVIKCFVCGAEGESLTPVWKEGFKPDEKEKDSIQKVTTFDDITVQWTQDALDRLEEYPDGHVRRRAQARVEKNARIQKIETISASFLNQVLNDKIVQENDKNEALNGYMDDAPEQTDYTWSAKAIERLELVPAGFMRENTKKRVLSYAESHNIKEITLQVCEDGIRDSVKMMEEAIANGAILEDFLPKKVDA